MKKIFHSVFVSVLIFWGLCPLCGEVPSEKGAVIEINKLSGKIQVDGKLDEDAWKNAVIIPLEYEKIWFREDGKRMARIEKAQTPFSFARLLWDENFIYFACYCEDEDILATQKGRDADIWTEDAFELFVCPSYDSNRYWEYEWSPGNQLLDIAWGEEKKDFEKDKKWNGESESAVTVNGTLNKHDDRDQGWVLEVKIPLKDFAPFSIDPEGWRITILHYSKWMEGGKKKVRTMISAPLLLTNDLEKYNKVIFRNKSQIGGK